MKLINVLATGPSLNRYRESSDTTIGVNKIVLTHKVDHLVCIDVAAGFPEFVLKKFRIGNYQKFYTHLYDEWKGIIPREIVKIDLLNRSSVDLDTDKYSYSISSPFVAVILAYKLGANIIDLYGADYNDHPSFKSPDTLKRIKTDFKLLQRELLKKGVSIRVTKESCLSEFLPLIPKSRMNLDTL